MTTRTDRPASTGRGGDRPGGDRSGGRPGGDRPGGRPGGGGRGGRGGERPGGGGRGAMGGAGGPSGPGGMRQRRRRRLFGGGKVCYFRANKITYIDYKNVELLLRFISHEGKILPRRLTGTSAKFQRMLTTAIKRARNIALLPYK